MLKANAFSMDKDPQSQNTMHNHQADFDAEKYINDFRLLDIRCGVLEEEKTDYLMNLQQTKDQMRAIEKTVGTLSTEKEDCLLRLKKV